MQTETCGVCEGTGFVEGSKCIYCKNGRYPVKVKSDGDPKCGEIQEVDG
jgi:hypothetical protein